MSSKSLYVKIDGINSFDTLLSRLKELDNKLPKHGLKQFSVFNKAYIAITSSIKQSKDNGYFDNPEFIEKFTIRFARHYFDALNKTLVNDNSIPDAWATLNKAAEYKSTPNFVFLLMGANAHINNDLALVLLELVEKQKTGNLLEDVLKIDKLLMKSGRELIHEFEEPNKFLNFLKNRFIFLYYRPTMYMVLYWRIKAWRNYESIKKSGLKNSGYNKSSIRISKRFLLLTKLLSAR